MASIRFDDIQCEVGGANIYEVGTFHIRVMRKFGSPRQTMIPRISRWLNEVKRDLDTPDLWDELRQEAELLGTNSDDVIENAPITPDEQKEIAERLQEVAEHARRTYSLSEAQMRVLDAKLDYLIEAAGQPRRKGLLQRLEDGEQTGRNVLRASLDR